MTTSPEDSTYLIGKDVPWKTIEQEACKVIHFTAVARVEGGSVIAAIKGMPYALLKVESPFLPGESMLPVVHRVDFITTWNVFEQRGIGEEEEALVIYAPPSGFLSSFKPRLHFYIHPKGHLEEAYDPSFKSSNAREWLRPIAEWHPKGWKP